MEDLKKLLASVKDITEENSYLIFAEIAQALFNKYEIQKGDKVYDFIEIEFYYYSKSHPDTTTYKRDTEVAQWFTHLSGMDIAFKTEAEKEEKQYGGILVRSIMESPAASVYGPLKTMIHLFNYLPRS
jgi:hypothetical protein